MSTQKIKNKRKTKKRLILILDHNQGHDLYKY